MGFYKHQMMIGEVDVTVEFEYEGEYISRDLEQPNDPEEFNVIAVKHKSENIKDLLDFIAEDWQDEFYNEIIKS